MTALRSDMQPSTDDELLSSAEQGPDASPFDYIVIGSGAGGGPLAARLALAGKRVLVLDAGGDPVEEKSKTYENAEKGEVTSVPAYHAAATEDYAMSWQFSVRHYADTTLQQRDEKYNQRADLAPQSRFLDPETTGRPGQGQGGIFYPRSAGIGGCTGHHAMIVAVPNDKDWNYIADLTGDESWRANRMRGYFTRLERCLYIRTYQRWFRRLLGPLYFVWQWLALQFDPRAVLDDGGHGTRGWQPTSFIEPALIEGIRSKDRGFTSLLVGAALAVLHSDNRLVGFLKYSLVWLRIAQHVDPNDLNTRRTSPEGVFLIPTGIESGDAVDVNGMALRGRRSGVREYLLATRTQHPDRLVIKTRAHVTRVLFAGGDDGGPPTAIGVEVAEGANLYEASPLRMGAPPVERRRRFFTRGEVVLCGGAFNTPQILQLSGIGDGTELAALAGEGGGCVLHGADGFPLRDGDGEVRRIELPGVGRNLQDRYEVSVISELADEFATLDKASFAPGDPDDPVRREWLETTGGLYRTNGGTLAVLHRSSVLTPSDPEPDLFAFGAPAAFRGYYFGWSRDLLRRAIGAPREQRNLWSWIILKAYTENQAGSVRLRSTDPFAQPQICFDSFNEAAERKARHLERLCAPFRRTGQPLPEALAAQLEQNRRILADSRRDLAALVDAVGFMRRINARNPERFTREVQPGPEIPDGSNALEEWIRTQAWGHHASCTCRMGADRWQPDTAQLRDRLAVLDSEFRVHGVRRLRVVDASVFPRIPGYFILTPILMISEKAADVLLAATGDDVYPPPFQATEAAAVAARRAKALRKEEDPAAAAVGHVGARPQFQRSPDHRLPEDTIGLALSGGGIRSATFALGVLQALARLDRIRDVDFLSTVSGGGFIGSFLGRLFTRGLVTRSADPVGRVQDTLSDGRSGALRWLRTQANYIFASGPGDVRQNVGVLWRNLAVVHLIVGSLLFAVFGGLASSARFLGLPALTVAVTEDVTIRVSPWWWLPVVALAVGVLPATFAYWLSPREGSYRAYPIYALVGWVLIVGGALFALRFPEVERYAYAVLFVMMAAWIWQEAARWGAVATVGSGGVTAPLATTIRNRLTRGLGEAVFIFVMLVGFVVLDTVAALSADKRSAAQLAGLLAVFAPVLPLLRTIAMNALRQAGSHGREGFSFLRAAKTLGLPLAVVFLWIIDAFAHQTVTAYPRAAIFVIGLAFVFSAVVGRAFDFLNLSSLRATYAARLARTFLGASNPERVYGAANDETRNVDLVHPDDDLPYDQYHPEEYGGPVHLINVCINETVDRASEREIRERKGLSMCVTPHGVGVGRQYFAMWEPPDDLPRWQKLRRWVAGIDGDDDPPRARRRTALRALPIGSSPNGFHVLKSKSSESAEVEPLSLAAWTSISGAAFTTGVGRGTSLPFSLFMGLTNVRLGYWWDTGIRPHERPERYPSPLWRRLKRAPSWLFSMQSMLLAEWRARFHGPAEWFWYLSDGGHFEVTGLYELIRRRVRLMIVCDSGEDPDYLFGDLAQLTQQVRIDFGAEITWLTPPFTALPSLLATRIQAANFGPIEGITRTSAHNAALAEVRWHGSGDAAWIVLLKPGIGGAGVSQDVVSYAKQRPAFPHQSTFDQFFDDNQWESYRALGQQIASNALR